MVHVLYHGRQKRRAAFTLIEILVVLVIIGLLIGILLPAVQRAREAARTTACAGNLRQVALAVANFEGRNHYYPSSWRPTAPDANGNIAGWSAQAQLLPYLEQSPVYSQINFNKGYDEATDIKTADGVSTKLSAVRIPTYVCPSEKRDEAVISNGQQTNYPLNYAMNLGVWFVYDPGTKQGGLGPFYPASRVRTSEVTDGLSYTLCAAEVKAWQPYYRNAAKTGTLNLPAAADVCGLGGDFKTSSGHTEWVDGRVNQIGFTATFAPNTPVLCDSNGTSYDVDWTNQQEGKSTTVPTYAAITARSYHVGGVNTVLLDGSVRWIADEIDLGVWQAYATRSGGEIIPASAQGR